MERTYHINTHDFEDEYIPSGSWFPQSFDDTNFEPFFAENHPPSLYSKDSHILDQTTRHNSYQDLGDSRESSPNTLRNVSEQNYGSSLIHHDFHNNTYQHLENSRESNLVNASEQTHDSCSSREDPFSMRCRIPMPDIAPVSGYQLWMETSFMCRRNERERQRVRSVNDGFSRLRNHLPRGVQIRRRQSKNETLRHAITYIKQLQKLVDNKTKEGEDNS